MLRLGCFGCLTLLLLLGLVGAAAWGAYQMTRTPDFVGSPTTPADGLRAQQKIFEIVREINSQGTPILLVEQNALMALDVANRGYVMETGMIALEGPAKDLRNDEKVRKAYLGEG